ncbi:dTDP-4-dehydrorhamnose reductase [Bradyrhizobium shewense]|uniref:dTDP-4-dehydrorhamnose reductase n=1 Tax=Bradyrhizobium shewense TaxID=1761772 RepID=A0A1C3WRS8_9BRAD|nr:dTDP-4-dehydrorhamnose reductase [Bradyrhizobium shewense]SCB42649.1 dTDP-4-dehydrorhamnose reductase [Bradyrhizobium shewense]
MRVLLTGASGQVGSALLRLLRKKYTVIAPASREFDLSQPDTLADRLDSIKPDLVINPAAYNWVDQAEDESALAFLINGTAPAVLARWAAAQGVPIVHFSTDYVFDGSGGRPWQEDDPTGPLSLYGQSKLAGERAVREAGGAHLVVRTAWVYAAEGVNFMRTIIRLAKQHETLRVVSDQFGTPTTAGTVASTLVQILQQGEADLGKVFDRAMGLLHVTNSGWTAWHGFASAIVQGVRSRGVVLKATSIVPIASKDYPAKAKRPANSQLDLSRLKDVYSIEPPSWETALAEELDTFLALDRSTV